MSDIEEKTLTTSLRAHTHNNHEKLDKRIMNLGLFENKELYKKFVTIQYHIHHYVVPIYENVELSKIIPDLGERNRFEKVEQDMQDLGIPLPKLSEPTSIKDISEAVGLLYVVEGSKLGAKFLLNLAKDMGLSESYGARHLGADKDGRGNSWRAFRDAIDAANINIDLALQSATHGFDKVRSFVEKVAA